MADSGGLDIFEASIAEMEANLIRMRADMRRMLDLTTRIADKCDKLLHLRQVTCGTPPELDFVKSPMERCDIAVEAELLHEDRKEFLDVLPIWDLSSLTCEVPIFQISLEKEIGKRNDLERLDAFSNLFDSSPDLMPDFVQPSISFISGVVATNVIDFNVVSVQAEMLPEETMDFLEDTLEVEGGIITAGKETPHAHHMFDAMSDMASNLKDWVRPYACHMFDEMSDKDVMSYYTMISNHIVGTTVLSRIDHNFDLMCSTHTLVPWFDEGMDGGKFSEIKKDVQKLLLVEPLASGEVFIKALHMAYSRVYQDSHYSSTLQYKHPAHPIDGNCCMHHTAKPLTNMTTISAFGVYLAVAQMVFDEMLARAMVCGQSKIFDRGRLLDVGHHVFDELAHSSTLGNSNLPRVSAEIDVFTNLNCATYVPISQERSSLLGPSGKNAKMETYSNHYCGNFAFGVVVWSWLMGEMYNMMGCKHKPFTTDGGNIRYVASELATEVIVTISTMIFYLHKCSLLSKSYFLQRSILTTSLDNTDEISLHDIHGGPTTFELYNNFCYGMVVFLHAYNVAAARNTMSYTESNQHEKSIKQKKRGAELQERRQKHPSKAVDTLVLPIIEGAAAQVREWSFANFTTNDASLFVRAIKKFRNASQISLIAAEVGGVVETTPAEFQIEPFEWLLDSCREAVRGSNMNVTGTLLDFFGVSVKAYEVLDRVEELQLLAIRIRRYQDPVSPFRLITNHNSHQWSKSCGWDTVDAASLLLGIHYHGIGNWEKTRLDLRLGLTRKIAPVTCGVRETFFIRAPILDHHSSVLRQKSKTLLPWSGELTIVGKCIDSISSKASVGPSIVTWSVNYNKKFSSITVRIQQQMHIVSNVWWIKDICELVVDLCNRVMIAVISDGRSSLYRIGTALQAYPAGEVPDSYIPLFLGDWARRNRSLVGIIIWLLTSDKESVCSYSFLLKLLKIVIWVGAEDLLKKGLVYRLSVQLHTASDKELLIPTRSPTPICGTLNPNILLEFLCMSREWKEEKATKISPIQEEIKPK